MSFTPKIVLCVTKLCEKLFEMTNPSLVYLFFFIMRICYSGSWVLDNLEIYRILIQFFKSKLNWIIQPSQNSNNFNLISLLFTKMLRLIGENYNIMNTNDQRINYTDILQDELFIVSFLWEYKKEDVLIGGRELFRQIMSVSKNKIPQLQKIFEEMSKMQSVNGQPTYLSLIYSQQQNEGFNYYTLVMIPPYMEKMLKFILFEVNKSQYVWYANLIMKAFKINYSEADKSLLIDITRYLITNYEHNLKSYTTLRWYLIGYILSYLKNELIAGEVKQALFFDWLFYSR